MITLESSDVYSVCTMSNFSFFNSATRFNFPDLYSPIPYQAYNCMGGCQPPYSTVKVGSIAPGDYINDVFHANPCEVVVGSYYAPTLAVPPQIRTLDPAWAACSLNLRGLYDPPVALISATAIATPSMNAAPGSTASTRPASTTVVDPAPASTLSSPTAERSSMDPPPLLETRSQDGAAPPASIPRSSKVGRSQSVPTPMEESTRSTVRASADQSADPGTSEVGQNHPTVAAGDDRPGQASSQITISVSLDGNSVASVGSIRVSADPANPSNIVLEGTTYEPGATTNIGGTPVSVVTGAIVVGGTDNDQAHTDGSGSTESNDASDHGSSGDMLESTRVFTFAGITHTAVDTSGNVVLNGTGMDPNAAVTAASDAQTIAPGQWQNSQDGPASLLGTLIYKADGHTLTALQVSDASNVMYIDGATLSVDGAATTLHGAFLTLASNGLLLDASLVTPLQTAPAGGAEIQNIFGSKTMIASQVGSQGAAGILAIDGTTISPGGPAITEDGTELSAAPYGLVVGGTRTLLFASSAGDPKSATMQAVVTLGSEVLTAMAPSGLVDDIVIAGATLSPGGPAATIDATVVSAVYDGLVVGASQTVALSSAMQEPIAEQIVTLGGQTFTARTQSGSAGIIVVDGVTLSPGGPDAIVNGVDVSVGTGGVLLQGSPATTSSISSMTSHIPADSVGLIAAAATAAKTAVTTSGCAAGAGWNYGHWLAMCVELALCLWLFGRC